MLTVHHLNDSRSQRILWLLEELELPYEIIRYERDPQTRLAPASLKAVSPLGKSPVITDSGRTIIESGAIIDYIIRRHGAGRLQPDPASALYDSYQQWMHFAEGSAMLPLMLHLYTSRFGEAVAPLRPRIDSEIASHLSFLEGALSDRDYLIGDFSGADIQMSFVGEVAASYGLRANYPALDAWARRFQARPAYARAIEKGGAYIFATDRKWR